MTEKLFGIKNTFVCEHPVLLTDNLRAKHLYRMVQESINNAVKHGHADSIIVSLTGGNGKGTITIRDNGMGIKVATASQVGMGLRSMAHRAYLIGGHLEIKPASPSGTEVTCSFPLESTVSPSTTFLENEEELTGALAI